MIITKELLSEVWGEEVTKIDNQCVMWDMDVLPFWSFEPEKYEGLGKSEKRFCIAIETIANKCKEWAISKGYQFEVFIQCDGTECWKVGKCGYGWNEYICSNIAEACQWILDNKETK